jgi:hypothetical protein
MEDRHSELSVDLHWENDSCNKDLQKMKQKFKQMDDDAMNLYLKEHVIVSKVKSGNVKELMGQCE